MLQGPELLEEVQGIPRRFGGRRLEPLEGEWVTTPGQQVEQRRGEIDAEDLGFAVSGELVSWIPQSYRGAGSRSSGPAGALLRGVAGDAFDLETIDSGTGVASPAGLQPSESAAQAAAACAEPPAARSRRARRG